MRTRFRVLLSAILVIPMLFGSSVAAVEGNTTTNNTDTKKTTTTDNKTTTTTTSDDKLTPQQRLDKRKAEMNLKLTTVEQNRIKAKCKAAQGLFGPINTHIKDVDTARNAVYKELTDRLNDLSTKLKNQGVDTTELNTEITALNVKIATFKTDLTAYKLAVSDLAGMDCVADPVAFKASLETARAAKLKVSADALAIRNYVTTTIKPTLVKLRQQVEKKV